MGLPFIWLNLPFKWWFTIVNIYSTILYHYWLVVWNIFSIYWECHPPNGLSYFSERWLNHQPDRIFGFINWNTYLHDIVQYLCVLPSHDMHSVFMTFNHYLPQNCPFQPPSWKALGLPTPRPLDLLRCHCLSSGGLVCGDQPGRKGKRWGKGGEKVNK